MNITKVIPSLALMILAVAVSAPAAAENYHPDDVAAINKLLEINDAENKMLAGSGWEIGRPETWVVLEPKMKKIDNRLIWTINGRLQVLNLRGFRLTGPMDLTGLDSLTRLDLSDNDLTAVRGLAGLTGLKELNLSHNRLTGLEDLSALAGLRQLWLTNNELTELTGLGGLKNLESLSLGRNSLADLPGLGGLENLESLSLEFNRLTRLPDFSRLKKLTGLGLAGNRFENYPALETLDWSRIDSFGYSGDQCPVFSLADKAPKMLALEIWSAPELESIDLAGRPVSLLTLYGHLTADKIHNPGPGDFVWIYHDNNYSMAEFTALVQAFRPTQVLPFAAQTTTLGDAAVGLKVNTPYRLEDLSPRLAGELAAAGQGGRLLAVHDLAALGPLAYDFEHKLKPGFLTLNDGQVTFNLPGEFYLVVTSGPKSGAEQSYAAVGYLDPFTLSATAR